MKSTPSPPITLPISRMEMKFFLLVLFSSLLMANILLGVVGGLSTTTSASSSTFASTGKTPNSFFLETTGPSPLLLDGDDNHNDNDNGEEEEEDRLVTVFSPRKKKNPAAMPANTRGGGKQTAAAVTVPTTTTTIIKKLLPIFWHIPKSGGTSMKRLAQCLGIVGVNQEGKLLNDDDKGDTNGNGGDTRPVAIVQRRGGHWVVNVDVSTREGIQAARERGFADFVAEFQGHTRTVSVNDHSGGGYYIDDSTTGTGRGTPAPVVEVQVLDIMVATPLLQDATHSLLGADDDKHAVGALFALFRHPVERAVSLFYYLQHADWESTYRPELANTTLLDVFCLNDDAGGDKKKIPMERNWMTYYLAVEGRPDRQTQEGLTNNNKALQRDDLEYAKTLLEQKMLVGLTDDMGESIRRFGLYFGWNSGNEDHHAAQNSWSWNSCRSQLTEHGANAFDHPKVEPGSPEWDAIAAWNTYDMELYEYAVQVFERQSVLFEKMVE
jgi:hypothetical protein